MRLISCNPLAGIEVFHTLDYYPYAIIDLLLIRL